MSSMATAAARKTVALGRMVKIEHSVFALPFAYLGTFLAARGWPGTKTFIALTVAMVAVRSFAMAVNRIADLPFDRKNPRTASRPLVTGEIGLVEAWIFLVVAAAVFVAACWTMNRLCLYLAGPALAWSALYSVTKRFTVLCHFFLGSVLGLAPLAGWLAFDPRLTLSAVLFFFGVTFWVAGFDLLYACQDTEFDRKEGLKSLPARMGRPVALALSTFCHANTVIFFLLGVWSAGLGVISYLTWAAVSLIMLAEHTIISPQDMSRVNTAFFTMNGLVSVLFFLGVLVDILV